MGDLCPTTCEEINLVKSQMSELGKDLPCLFQDRVPETWSVTTCPGENILQHSIFRNKTGSIIGNLIWFLIPLIKSIQAEILPHLIQVPYLKCSEISDVI